MRTLKTHLAIVVSAILAPTGVMAGDIPNVIGTWKGKTHSIMVGQAGSLPAGGGTWEKPLLFENDLVIEITNQEGRRFWGRHSVGGKPQGGFIAVIAVDGKEYAAIDEDGSSWGSFDGADRIRVCYTNVDSPKSKNSVVGCTAVERQK